MDVTRHNINEALPKFAESLALCDFYALDEEMTGISALWGKDTEFESPIGDPAVAYSVGRKVANKYHVTQVGISLFRLVKEAKASGKHEIELDSLVGDRLDEVDEGEDGNEKQQNTTETANAAEPKYEVTTFNFHVSPQSRNSDLIINADTADFLRRNSFDFNKWLDNGIPYVAKAPKKKRPSPPKEPAVAATSAASEGKEVVPAAATPGDLAAKEAEEKLVDEAEPLPEIGFNSVYQALVASKKAFVGHNCFADLLFLTSHFGSSTLPESYPAYKRRLRTQFPTIYDTKRICSQLPVETFAATGTSLGSLFKLYEKEVSVEVKKLSATKAPPFVDRASGGQETHQSSKGSTGESETITQLAHHAGYDAQMTGVVFLALKKQLSDNSRWCDGLFEGGTEGCVFSKEFANQIALFRSVYRCDLESEVDPFLPSFGAAVLKLVPGTGINAEKKKAEVKSSDDSKDAAKKAPDNNKADGEEVPQKLDNGLICGCVREMLPPKEALKTKDSSIFYYRLNAKSAVVWLPEHATLKLQPRSHVQARVFQPVEQRAAGVSPDPFHGIKRVSATPSSGGFLKWLFRRR